MRSMSLVSESATPCGVEAFARGLATHLAAGAPGAHAVARLPDGLSSLASLGRLMAAYDTLIVNLPLVAWKRRLVMPLVVLAWARLRRRNTALMLHEWADLDWKRRALLRVYVPFATRLLFSSPHVAAQFAGDRVSFIASSRRDILPIPLNVARPAVLAKSAVARQLGEARADGRFVLGHFGSIYPKKQSDQVLEIAAALKRQGCPVQVALIGDFVDRSELSRAGFEARAAAMGLAGDVLISGYIKSPAELYAALEAVDLFVYRFAEGLTSRRGSVMTCLAAGRPVVVNAPADAKEFDHHRSYREQIAGHRLRLAASGASVAEMAASILEWRRDGFDTAGAPTVDFAAAWDDVVAAVLREPVAAGTPKRDCPGSTPAEFR